jgi:hypothetical protein
MNAAGEYVYFLLITSLYGAPLAFLLLAFAWRAGQQRRALIAVAIALPVIAGTLQIGFHLSTAFMSREYEATQAAITTWIGTGYRDNVLDGRFLGTADIRPGVLAKRYVFTLPEHLGDGGIEVWLPIDGAHMPGRLVLGSDSSAETDVGAPARLLLQPRTRSLNPAVAPARYFNEFHPLLDRNAFGPHTLIAQIRPRSSVIVHPHVPPRENAWRHSRVELIVE